MRCHGRWGWSAGMMRSRVDQVENRVRNSVLISLEKIQGEPNQSYAPWAAKTQTGKQTIEFSLSLSLSLFWIKSSSSTTIFCEKFCALLIFISTFQHGRQASCKNSSVLDCLKHLICSPSFSPAPRGREIEQLGFGGSNQISTSSQM